MYDIFLGGVEISGPIIKDGGDLRVTSLFGLGDDSFSVSDASERGVGSIVVETDEEYFGFTVEVILKVVLCGLVVVSGSESSAH